MKNKTTNSIPPHFDLPTQAELEDLSRLRDDEDAAKRAYDQAVVDFGAIFGEELSVADQARTLQSNLERELMATQAAATELKTWKDRTADVRTALNRASSQLLGSVGTEVPLLLLPVRLETRFEYGEGGDKPQALRIRIYPDDIHVDSHETKLSVDEHVWGRTFVATYERAASDAERLGAWRLLSDRFGARRAAWIAATKLKR